MNTDFHLKSHFHNFMHMTVLGTNQKYDKMIKLALTINFYWLEMTINMKWFTHSSMWIKFWNYFFFNNSNFETIFFNNSKKKLQKSKDPIFPISTSKIHSPSLLNRTCDPIPELRNSLKHRYLFCISESDAFWKLLV